MGEQCAGECNYELGGIVSNIQVNTILWRRQESIGKCPELIGARDTCVLTCRQDRPIRCHGARLLEICRGGYTWVNVPFELEGRTMRARGTRLVWQRRGRSGGGNPGS